MTYPNEENVGPVTQEGQPQKTPVVALIGWILAGAIGLFIAFTITMGVLVSRSAAKKLRRSTYVMTISNAITQYEQAYNVAIASLPDWKKTLIDTGYIDKESFDSTFAVNEKMDYLVLSRPKEQFVAGSPSWIAIYEDPRVLFDPKGNIQVVIQGDGYARFWNNGAELTRYLQQKCQEIGVPFDVSASYLPAPEEIPQAPASPK